jgi:hypothetical protein
MLIDLCAGFRANYRELNCLLYKKRIRQEQSEQEYEVLFEILIKILKIKIDIIVISEARIL